MSVSTCGSGMRSRRRGFREALGVVDADAPPGENAGEHVGKAMGLRDGESDRALGGIAALDPGAAEGGIGDAQEGLRQKERR